MLTFDQDSDSLDKTPIPEFPFWHAGGAPFHVSMVPVCLHGRASLELGSNEGRMCGVRSLGSCRDAVLGANSGYRLDPEEVLWQRAVCGELGEPLAPRGDRWANESEPLA